MPYLDPTDDYAFKRIFSNKECLIGLLNAVLATEGDEEIIDLDYLQNDPDSLIAGRKCVVYDLRVRTKNNTRYIVEMQKQHERDYLARAQCYISYDYSIQLVKRDRYVKLEPVVLVAILNFNVFEDADVPYISYHRTIESSTGRNLLKAHSYVFIELKKFKCTNPQTILEQWLYFLKHAKDEDRPAEGIKNEKVHLAYNALVQIAFSEDGMRAYLKSRLNRRNEIALKKDLERAEENMKKAEEGKKRAEEATKQIEQEKKRMEEENRKIQEEARQERLRSLEQGIHQGKISAARAMFDLGIEKNIVCDKLGLELKDLDGLICEKESDQ